MSCIWRRIVIFIVYYGGISIGVWLDRTRQISTLNFMHFYIKLVKCLSNFSHGSLG